MKQYLLDAFNESLLQEGNRKHKQALYAKQNNTSTSNNVVNTTTTDDTVENDTITQDDIVDALYNLFLFGETIRRGDYLNNKGIYHLVSNKDFYYNYYTYMFDNGYLDNDKNYNMDSWRTLHRDMKNKGSDDFRTDANCFPLISGNNKMFINVINHQILAETKDYLVVMSAFMPAEGNLMRSYLYSPWHNDSRCKFIIEEFVHGDEGGGDCNNAEDRFYKDVYGINIP